MKALAELTGFDCESCMNGLGSRGMTDEGSFDAAVPVRAGDEGGPVQEVTAIVLQSPLRQ